MLAIWSDVSPLPIDVAEQLPKRRGQHRSALHTNWGKMSETVFRFFALHENLMQQALVRLSEVTGRVVVQLVMHRWGGYGLKLTFRGSNQGERAGLRGRLQRVAERTFQARLKHISYIGEHGELSAANLAKLVKMVKEAVRVAMEIVKEDGPSEP